YVEGLGYLAVYNLMYVAPLIAILAVTTSRPVAKRLAIWERAHTVRTRLVSGVVMFLLGVFILWAL
ncbi:MAG: hypothetical protein HYX89_05395, partial [Chloroflexi bacterium]|nr:hypothetical protein [Chloroflexota bacterium]